MFLIEKQKSYNERVCPNRHDLSLVTMGRDDSVKYCTDCGSELVIQTVTYSVFICSHCVSPVNESWNYCPYCGQKKEG